MIANSGDTFLRPRKFSFQFIALPLYEDGQLVWHNLEFRSDPDIGVRLFIKNAPAGLLIPMGGFQLSHEYVANMLKRPSKGSIEYLVDCGEYVYDCDPTQLSTRNRYAWPGAYANELPLDSSGKYNAAIVVIDRDKYCDELPKYPQVRQDRYMCFIEIMGYIRRGVWTEVFAYYGRSRAQRTSGRPQYSIQPYNPETRCGGKHAYWYMRPIDREAFRLCSPLQMSIAVL